MPSVCTCRPRVRCSCCTWAWISISLFDSWKVGSRSVCSQPSPLPQAYLTYSCPPEEGAQAQKESASASRAQGGKLGHLTAAVQPGSNPAKSTKKPEPWWTKKSGQPLRAMGTSPRFARDKIYRERKKFREELEKLIEKPPGHHDPPRPQKGGGASSNPEASKKKPPTTGEYGTATASQKAAQAASAAGSQPATSKKKGVPWWKKKEGNLAVQWVRVQDLR